MKTTDGSKGWCWKCGQFQPATNQACIKCGASRPVRKSAPWTWQGALFLTVTFGIVIGVGYGAYTLVARPSDDATEAPLFEMLDVIGEPVVNVDALLGPPTSVVPIENVPENMPGEFRDYALLGIPDPVSVRFHRGRAVFITVLLPHGEVSAEDALSRVGIHLDGVPPSTTAPMATWWRSGRIRGKTFERMGALRGMNGSEELFDMVQAELR